MAKKRPTLSDVLEGMNSRFNMVFAQFEQNNKQFALISTKLYTLDREMEELKEIQKEIIWES